MISPSILAVITVLLVYSFTVLYQRLFLSPIASFPGPKLAAATYWVEFYYDVILGGKYIWKVKEWHLKYGRIIRISPHELHVADPAFWEVIYPASTNSNRRDKWKWQTDGLGIPLSTIAAESHALHRLRRGALNPFFSMQNVRKMLPVIQERADALVKRFKEAGERNEVVQMEYANSAFANDVVMQFCFGRFDHHIEAPNFDPVFHIASFNAGKAVSSLKHMQWILTIMNALPESCAPYFGEEVSANFRLKRMRMIQIEAIRRGEWSKEAGNFDTIFHSLLDSDLPEIEKQTTRLAEEAILLVGAGTETTAWVLTVITFHLLAKPSLLRRLKTELNQLEPEADGRKSLLKLEKLPFLTGVLKEGLRLAHGVTSRNARIAVDTAIKCEPFTIPPGTPVSMTAPLTHHDPTLFANPDVFDPDRWLAPDSSQLDKYIVAFSKGSRACLGINLAWAEMYVAVSEVFGNFGSREVRDEKDVGIMELYETDERDVTFVSDMFLPIMAKGSKGVRVKIST